MGKRAVFSKNSCGKLAAFPRVSHGKPTVFLRFSGRKLPDLGTNRGILRESVYILASALVEVSSLVISSYYLVV